MGVTLLFAILVISPEASQNSYRMVVVVLMSLVVGRRNSTILSA
jgi:hypothetical protein